MMVNDSVMRRISARQTKLVLNISMAMVGGNVQHYRQKKGLTQNELAFMMYSTPDTISAIETNKDHNPELLTLIKIAHVLEIELIDLFRNSQ